MTFDVAQLPGRAEELKKACISMLTAMGEEFDTTGAGYGTSQKLAEQAFAGVEHIYDDWLDIPSPDDFSQVISNLGLAEGKLAGAGWSTDPATKVPVGNYAQNHYGEITTTASYLQPWTGDAASAYQDGFAGGFGQITSNQFTAASVLRNAVGAEAGVWKFVRETLDHLSSDAIDKVNECMHKSPSDWKVALAVAGGVFAITGGLVGAAISGGSTIPVAFTAVSSTMGVISAATSGDPGDGSTKDYVLATGNPIKIVESLQNCLSYMDSQITDGENDIITAMNQNVSAVHDAWAAFCQPRPALADAPQHSPVDPNNTYFGHDA